MLNEPEKELLTDELIKYDLIYHLNNDKHVGINFYLFAISVFSAFVFNILTPFSWLIILVYALLLLLWYIGRKKKIKDIKNGEFDVVVDNFLFEKQKEVRKDLTAYKGRWISYLQFSTNGRWEVDQFYYTWSDKYKMSGAGICNTSASNDKFYLVLYKNTRKIAIGYNMKFFEYKKSLNI